MRGTQRDAEFVEFVTAQRPALMRMARLLTAGDDALAEDLVQTTLTKLYVHWPRVRRAGNPVGYARTSLTHAFVDEQRRAHRRRETTTDLVRDRAATAPTTASARRCSPRSPAWLRGSARSSYCGTGSTSTPPRPPASCPARPGP